MSTTYKRVPVYTKAQYGAPVAPVPAKKNSGLGPEKTSLKDLFQGLLAMTVFAVVLVTGVTACENAQKPVVKESPYECLKKLEPMKISAELEIANCGLSFKSTENSSGEGFRGTRSIFGDLKCDEVEALGLGKDQTELDSLKRLRRVCVN